MSTATVLRLRFRSLHAHASSPTAVMAQFAAGALRALRYMWCTMNGGHYRVLHTEPNRMALRCVGCGHTTPGWDIGTTRPIPRYAGDPERFRIGRAPQAAQPHKRTASRVATGVARVPTGRPGHSPAQRLH